jgi:hypothetical protein
MLESSTDPFGIIAAGAGSRQPLIEFWFHPIESLNRFESEMLVIAVPLY